MKGTPQEAGKAMPNHMRMAKMKAMAPPGGIFASMED